MIPVYLKVHLTPKYFLRSNKSLHLFDTHCAFLPIFNPNLDFLQAVKSGHHLVHDWVSKGYGSIPGLTSQTSLHACLQRLNTMQISLWHQTRNRPIPLTSSVVWQMMTWFRIFYNLKKKSRLSLKRRSAFRTDAKIYLSEKNILGLPVGALEVCKIQENAPDWKKNVRSVICRAGLFLWTQNSKLSVTVTNRCI